MNELEYGQQIQELLNFDSVSKKYFKKNNLKIESMLKRWNDKTIRIGLVGVTSSGKSTLLNALLGENILPTAVRPSSGSIIICSKGETTRAEIIFEDGTSELIDEKNIVAALEKYGDEENNANNQFGVKEIHLQSKNFLLAKNIQIIDSPGLDAYGLERHEELTLSTLLPTIDLCLYVVTFKTNSDETTKRILEQVYQYNKPMIIVQNMLDSIVPKLGKNGHVEKSREVIASEHFQRTKRILDAINPKLHEIVQVVQLSAKRAVDGRREADNEKLIMSQINDLLNLISAYNQKMGPQLFRTRGSQLQNELTDILEEEGKLRGNKKTFDREIRMIEEELKRQITSTETAQQQIRDRKEELEQMLNQFEREMASYQLVIFNLSIRDLASAKEILLRMKKSSREIEKKFLDQIKISTVEVNDFFKTLGYDLSEIIRSTSLEVKRSSTKDYFELKSASRTLSKQVESPGVMNKAKRILGSLFDSGWGYESIEENIEELDKQAICHNIEHFERNFNGIMSNKVNEWEQQLQLAMTNVYDMQEQQMIALDEKKTTRNEMKHVFTITSQLANIEQALDKDILANEKTIYKEAIKMKHEKSIVLSGKTTNISIQTSTFHLYELSRQISQTIFLKCIQHIEQRNADLRVHNKTIIVGWDDLSLVQFAYRYFNVHISNEDQKKLSEIGLIVENNVFIVNDLVFNHDHPEFEKAIKSEDFNTYILADVAQSGQAKKQIVRSRFLQHPVFNQVVCNIVMQSFKEFTENGAYREALEMLDDLKTLPIFDKGEILINDASPLFTLMHIELDQSRTIIYDATQLTQFIQGKMSYLINSGLMHRAFHEYLHALTNRNGGRHL
ncbi:dynamin family protein [uncultured Planococcus sp.]|uniref:dynamin family protein n=1 Tax=uncultured Planococcus sp. TaxID=337815 RepID=UPI0026056D51|nr:dynamin family protein [uncultured Planococcus sp.]